MTQAEFAILSLLAEQNLHGYQIEKLIAARGMRQWTHVAFSSIYFLLKKLEKQGLITAQLQQPDGQKRSKKVYQLSPQGFQHLKQQALYVLSTPETSRGGFMLGLSLLPLFSSAQILAALQQFTQNLIGQREALLMERTQQQPLPLHVNTMFEYSISQMTSEIHWLENYIIQLKENLNDGQTRPDKNL